MDQEAQKELESRSLVPRLGLIDQGRKKRSLKFEKIINKKNLHKAQNLTDVDQIRKITKNVYKQLNPFVDDSFNRVPIFGYPQICYSPRRDSAPVQRTFSEAMGVSSGAQQERQSKWQYISRSIFSKSSNQVKELLDGREQIQFNEEALLKSFALGKPHFEECEKFEVTEVPPRPPISRDNFGSPRGGLFTSRRDSTGSLKRQLSVRESPVIKKPSTQVLGLMRKSTLTFKREVRFKEDSTSRTSDHGKRTVSPTSPTTLKNQGSRNSSPPRKVIEKPTIQAPKFKRFHNAKHLLKISPARMVTIIERRIDELLRNKKADSSNNFATEMTNLMSRSMKLRREIQSELERKYEENIRLKKLERQNFIRSGGIPQNSSRKRMKDKSSSPDQFNSDLGSPSSKEQKIPPSYIEYQDSLECLYPGQIEAPQFDRLKRPQSGDDPKNPLSSQEFMVKQDEDADRQWRLEKMHEMIQSWSTRVSTSQNLLQRANRRYKTDQALFQDAEDIAFNILNESYQELRQEDRRPDSNEAIIAYKRKEGSPQPIVTPIQQEVALDYLSQPRARGQSAKNRNNQASITQKFNVMQLKHPSTTNYSLVGSGLKSPAENNNNRSQPQRVRSSRNMKNQTQTASYGKLFFIETQFNGRNRQGGQFSEESQDANNRIVYRNKGKEEGPFEFITDIGSASEASTGLLSQRVGSGLSLSQRLSKRPESKKQPRETRESIPNTQQLLDLTKYPMATNALNVLFHGPLPNKNRSRLQNFSTSARATKEPKYGHKSHI